MAYILGGSLGFLLFFLYDWNSVVWNSRWLHRAFFAGCVLVGGATLALALGGSVRSIGLLSLAVLFLALLLYTLFFALPFKETYLRQGEGKPVHDRGIYGLCRHPGWLWMTGLHFSLWGGLGTGRLLFAAVVFSSLNLLYVLFQDHWTFPRTFGDYERYKRQTPFLIPSCSSIRWCMGTWGSERGASDDI
ncbi:hypothetical protein [Anaerotalea alkaliphila]|uniref:Isoprenylcysteine carboxylmethyltransferase family protein n=1 Tax=Anaerotalea alkaliphila TaxID=2662126 RepID=A0A7X5HWU5_9FIRM|nr:hypothetical protein [Anaerotalea alkaliphila]NDL68107.1 hypothetical protein [Anaerotalea alkaliphila]